MVPEGLVGLLIELLNACVKGNLGSRGRLGDGIIYKALLL
jgi:hypothetical protein